MLTHYPMLLPISIHASPILIHALPSLIHLLGFRLHILIHALLSTRLGNQSGSITLGSRQPIRIEYYVTRFVSQPELSITSPELSLRHPRSLDSGGGPVSALSSSRLAVAYLNTSGPPPSPPDQLPLLLLKYKEISHGKSFGVNKHPRTDWLKKELHKNLFVKTDTLLDKIRFCPRIKLSNSQS